MGRLPSFCPHCGRVVPAGSRCPCRQRKRRPTANDATRGEREPWRKAYGTKQYRDARQEVIRRQDGRCADCGRVCAVFDGTIWRTAELGGEVDHEEMLRRGAGSKPDDMVLRCRSCHAKRDAARRRAP